MDPQLRPGPLFENLLERPRPARQGNKAIRQRRHFGFPLVHILDHMQLCQAAVGNFPLHQAARHHADHHATGLQRRIGDRPHQTNFAAAIDKRQPLLRQRTSNQTGGFEVQRMFAS